MRERPSNLFETGTSLATLLGAVRYAEPAVVRDLLGLRHGGEAIDLVARVAARPLSELIRRPGKRFRGRLVDIGYELATGTPPEGRALDHCCRLADAIEALHTGSLVIDDLQDGSRVRRGLPSLHVRYGVPIAVNAGNLLYFAPADAASSLGLPPEQEVKLLRTYHRTLVRAHLGQAIDVAVPIDTIAQANVAGVCLASMELKSGALFSMSLVFGAILAGADDASLDVISDFGADFGIALQMFDDVGNVRGEVEPAKRWEDLRLRRPTWIWACAARHFSPEIYGDFVSAAHRLAADDTLPLQAWFEQHDMMARATRLAHDHLNESFEALESELSGPRRSAASRLRHLGAEITAAYG